MISLAPEALERVAERRGAKPSGDPSPEVGCTEQWVTAPTSQGGAPTHEGFACRRLEPTPGLTDLATL